MSYLLINRIVTKPGGRDEMTRLLLESARAFDGVEACVMSLVAHDVDDPDVIWVQDVWTDEAAHEAAMADPAMRGHVAQAMPLLVDMAEQHRVTLVGGRVPF